MKANLDIKLKKVKEISENMLNFKPSREENDPSIDRMNFSKMLNHKCQVLKNYLCRGE